MYQKKCGQLNFISEKHFVFYFDNPILCTAQGGFGRLLFAKMLFHWFDYDYMAKKNKYNLVHTVETRWLVHPPNCRLVCNLNTHKKRTSDDLLIKLPLGDCTDEYVWFTNEFMLPGPDRQEWDALSWFSFHIGVKQRHCLGDTLVYNKIKVE